MSAGVDKKEEERSYYVGVDVGTSSVRAGVVDERGFVVSKATRPITTWKPKTDFYEQSSEEVWRATCECVKEALQGSAAAGHVKGISFDATCSLVALDAEGKPVTVSPTKRDEQNIVVWLDHRALNQTERINRSANASDPNDPVAEVLRYVGGRISPEMENPKLLWLKENMAEETWKRATKFFDLADYLTFRATGDETRSLCTLVCKWTFLGHKAAEGDDNTSGWKDGFFQKVGLGDFVDDKYERIGRRVRPMGTPVGSGLDERAANEIGLPKGTPVGVGIIDAHAGGIGLLGCGLKQAHGNLESVIGTRLAVICGTSSCHMAASKDPLFIEGIWGPYFSAMIPGMWLTEGGQSATGALIDHIIDSHVASAYFKELAAQHKTSVYEELNKHVEELVKQSELPFPAALTKNLHVFPDFHGNRSPRADPSLRGMVVGLRLSSSNDDLALLYLATIQSVAHGTRHIISEMNKKGFSINTILLTGGLSKNPLFVREHADVTGCSVILSNETDCMLLGTGIIAAVASEKYPSILEAMRDLDPGIKETIAPGPPAVLRYHAAKHEVYHKLYEDQLKYRDVIAASLS